MLMRNTSAPARNNCSTTSGLSDDGPSVARIFTLRWRLIVPRSVPCAVSVDGLRLVRVGQLNRPVLRVPSGVDLEKARALITPHKTIFSSLDPEFPVPGAHEGFAFPLAAAFVHRID